MSRAAEISAVIVECDGVPLPDTVTRTLAAVRVERHLSLPALCEIEFHEPPAPLASAHAPRAGGAVRVSVRGASEPLFEGQWTAFEERRDETGRHTLRWRGYDLLHRLRKNQPVRAFVEVTALDLAREICAPLQLSVEADESGPLWRRVLQLGQSDLELLVDRARRAGLYASLRRGVLRLTSLDGLGEPIELTVGRELRQVEVEVNAETPCHSVSVRGWNAARITEESAKAALDAVRHPQAPGLPGLAGRTLVNTCVEGATEAEHLARSVLDARTMRGAVLRAVAEGDTRLHPATRVRLRGLGAGWPSVFALASVVHRVDARSGFTTSIATEPPPPDPPRPAAVSLGIVSDVADPERLGRVRVELPGHGEVETDWLQVACPAAGAGKGLIAVPDVGDRVVLLAFEADLDRAIVIGGVFADQGPADPEARREATSRIGLRTRSGHSLVLDGARDLVRVEDARGSYIEFTPEAVRLHSKAELTVEAPGQRIVLRADKIDFERLTEGELLLLLSDRAVLQCAHAGQIGVPATQDLVWSEGSRLLVEPDPVSKAIAACPNVNVGIKPCTSTLGVKTGYSGWLRIAGRAVCLDSLRGLTDGTPPNVVEYSVVRAGQELVRSQESS